MGKYYLFVHFRETRTPEGEQVYFAVSNDGFRWESLNDGRPVLESNIGEKGVRDFTIIRTKENEFIILATDLSLANRVDTRYGTWADIIWPDISRNGSHNLIKWTSKDLLHWSQPKAIQVVDSDYGCVWAPDILYDEKSRKYMVHWSSPHTEENYQKKKIFCAFTEDFEIFTEPQVLYQLSNLEVIDSCTFKDNEQYYCFVKIEGTEGVRLLTSNQANRGYKIIEAFEKSSPEFTSGKYEAPTVFKLPDHRWCLMLDFYGTKNETEQGYVPFLCDDLASGKFYRASEQFFFPYGFKHGTVLEISEEEYDKLRSDDIEW